MYICALPQGELYQTAMQYWAKMHDYVSVSCRTPIICELTTYKTLCHCGIIVIAEAQPIL
jgi:hypothetical protein